MPNFWAHRLCAGLTLEQLEGTMLADLIRNNSESFHLGSQGADMMYFRPLQFLKGRKGVTYHAKMLHSQPVELLAEMGRQYFASPVGQRQIGSTFAYVCGFLCHHAVDQMVHPFIESHTSSLLKHRRIELDFDAYLSNALGLCPDKANHHWMGISGFMGFAGLAQYYNFMFHKLFEKKFKPRSYIKDFKAMKRVSGLLDKPRRLEKPKHTDRPYLTDRDLRLMMAAALQGAEQAGVMIRALYQELEGLLSEESEAVLPGIIPQSIGI